MNDLAVSDKPALPLAFTVGDVTVHVHSDGTVEGDLIAMHQALSEAKKNDLPGNIVLAFLACAIRAQ